MRHKTPAQRARRAGYLAPLILLMLGVLLMIIGVQFISFGLLGEMIAHISPREDEYAIRETVNDAIGSDD